MATAAGSHRIPGCVRASAGALTSFGILQSPSRSNDHLTSLDHTCCVAMCCNQYVAMGLLMEPCPSKFAAVHILFSNGGSRMDRACVRQVHWREPSGLCITISKAHTQQRLCRRRCMQFWCLQARIWHRTCASPGVWGQWSSGCWNLFELLEQAAQENLACTCLHKVFKCRLSLQARSAYLGHWMYSRLAFRAQNLRRMLLDHFLAAWVPCSKFSSQIRLQQNHLGRLHRKECSSDRNSPNAPWKLGFFCTGVPIAASSGQRKPMFWYPNTIWCSQETNALWTASSTSITVQRIAM